MDQDCAVCRGPAADEVTTPAIGPGPVTICDHPDCRFIVLSGKTSARLLLEPERLGRRAA